MALTPLKIFTAHGQHMFTPKGVPIWKQKLGEQTCQQGFAYNCLMHPVLKEKYKIARINEVTVLSGLNLENVSDFFLWDEANCP